MPTRLSSVRIENFKAVADSGMLRLDALNAFIGNNGSGKSSVIEGLQTLQRLVTDGLDVAMQAFKGMEHVRHRAHTSTAARRRSGIAVQPHAMRFLLRGSIAVGEEHTLFRSDTKLNATEDANRYFVERDTVTLSTSQIDAKLIKPVVKRASTAKQLENRLGSFVRSWQFLNLNPDAMGHPAPTRRTSGAMLLHPSGNNLSDYLWHLVNSHGKQGTAAWDGIVEAVRAVLPYAGDVHPTMSTEIERRSSLTLQERFGKGGRQRFDVPGWMLSTGTLRVLALLAVLRHPEPAPLICIEELENGLDPRTVQLVVSEIRRLTESDKSQVVLTTHSPLLLNLLPLKSIIMTERSDEGVTFVRPEDSQGVKDWATDFSPGQLYLMGRLSGSKKNG
jgi:predicted ATPase